MTPEAQNRAIHEFVGGNKFVGLKKRGLWYRPDAKGYTSDENQAGRYTQEEAKGHEYVRGDADEWVRICHFKVPNYTGSLDAMSQAKKHLTREQRRSYVEFLTGELAEEFCDLAEQSEQLYAFNTFTAEQEARAFLLAVGRWQEKGEK